MKSADAFSPRNMPMQQAAEAMESRFALRVTAHLSEVSEGLSPDISERLRFARETAIQRALAATSVKQAAAAEARPVARTPSGAALLGQGGPRWWFKFAAVLPGIALLAGLVLIQHEQTSEQISVAAEIDAALLSDDLPPDAYSDAGFVEFLKTPPRE